MDATQKEVGLLKSDNNDAIYLRAKLESKTEELQVNYRPLSLKYCL